MKDARERRRKGTNLAKMYCVRGHKSRAEDLVMGRWAGRPTPFPAQSVYPQTEVTHMVASVLRSQPAGEAHIQRPPWMDTKMLFH